MKAGALIVAIALSLTAGVAVVAQQEREEGAGAPVGPPTEITTIKVDRVRVKTIKTEVPIPAPVRRDTPEFRGEGYFFQRCSVCHLGEWRKNGPIASYAPSLNGVLKDASREAFVRAYIQNGTANMPGFVNTFTPTQFDELIAYLRTL